MINHIHTIIIKAGPLVSCSIEWVFKTSGADGDFLVVRNEIAPFAKSMASVYFID